MASLLNNNNNSNKDNISNTLGDLPSAMGMYHPEFEKSACGVGMITSIDGTPNRKVIDYALEALKSIWHRGAVDADGKTGDGAGIHFQIPDTFLRKYLSQSGSVNKIGKIAVGQVFLPRTDLDSQDKCRQIVERHVLREGWKVLGWRQVPINLNAIGSKALSTRPEIEQILLTHNDNTSSYDLERNLYLIRRRIEKEINKSLIYDFYICSLSCRSIVYKGLFLAEQLSTFYPDLSNEDVISNYVIYHQRFSTNTFPSWKLAQPFHVLAHNGEINTLKGNTNWLKSHEAKLDAPYFGKYIKDIKNIIPLGASDSAALDAVFEVLLKTSRSLPEVKMLLIPEAWEFDSGMKKSWQDFYAYSHCVMEPWDGPAAICAYSEPWILSGLDRNGLRPLRYQVTSDNLLVVGSESGMIRIEPKHILASGQLQPGDMIAVNLKEGKLYTGKQLKDLIASSKNYEKLNSKLVNIAFPDESLKNTNSNSIKSEEIPQTQLFRYLNTVGYSFEDLEHILHPMVIDAKEPTGSMGDDTPLAVLSNQYRPWHHFFRQNFAQVTNPAIDSLRERYVMSLITRLGNLGNILKEEQRQNEVWQLTSPILLKASYNYLRSKISRRIVDISTLLQPNKSKSKCENLEVALKRICKEIETSAKKGIVDIFISDKDVDKNHPIIPMVLVISAIHCHLIKYNLRSFCSLNVVTSEAIDVHAFATMISLGATTIYPWLAQECILSRYNQKQFHNLTYSDACNNYRTAVENGLLKVMSKMGISVVSSYRGAINLEALGLSRSLTSIYFPGIQSRISGIGLNGIKKRVLKQHRFAWQDKVVPLTVGGYLKSRQSGEHHAWEGDSIHILQKACRYGTFFRYNNYIKSLDNGKLLNLRDVLKVSNVSQKSIPIEDVESITSIRKRLVAPGISLGALSPEAHACLAIAMNRIGAKSDSGEGGEDSSRFKPMANGDNPCSAIKQIASGRFGVTTEYLNHAVELEIKIAQGAKPGEGGQLPGGKVSPLIAKLRHSTPGITLISPPPHHDIYSIEDITQLIYDLKQVNPDAQVCVKLVARSGIGAIAAGVAKAHADVILISGHSGGTGASPISSIKYAGLPWEMGLSEVHQVLTLNGLRGKVKLRVDGGIKTGKDIVIAALLGAEEYGIGTAALIAMGCIMVRQCHNNTCPVGVCTQDEALRKHFNGKPEHVINLFTFLADDVRHQLGALGASSLSDIIGHTEFLQQISRGNKELDDLDLNPLLVKFDTLNTDFSHKNKRNPVATSLDEQIIKDAKPLFKDKEKMQLDYNVRNTHRNIGTQIASKITRTFGIKGLPPNHMQLTFRGTAGQSLGAFAIQGQRIELVGEANDFVGKGLSGGTIVIRRPATNKLFTRDHSILGNTVLYGATSGKLFAAGRAGQRFAIRNSGVTAVIEGCGDNACEYMTGGLVLILGEIGNNFAAGMTGGQAIVYSKTPFNKKLVNPDTVIIAPVIKPYWENVIYQLIESHILATFSKWSETILNEWSVRSKHFYHIVPKESLDKKVLEHDIFNEESQKIVTVNQEQNNMLASKI